MSEQRVFGLVKFYVEEKGYGFITPIDGGKDVFVHSTDLPSGVDYLNEKQKVSFVVAISDRKKGDGKKAVHLQLES